MAKDIRNSNNDKYNDNTNNMINKKAKSQLGKAFEDSQTLSLDDLVNNALVMQLKTGDNKKDHVT